MTKDAGSKRDRPVKMDVNMSSECQHENVVWKLCPNDRGWHCDDCSTDIGYSHDLDRRMLQEKVSSILFWLHEMSVIYVSNSTHADVITGRVMRGLLDRCAPLSQRAIVLEILTELY